LGTEEVLEPKHWSDYSLDESVLLLDNIVQELTLANLHSISSGTVIVVNGRSICATFINIDQTWFAVIEDGFGEKS